jgi:hypothetical protein
VMMRLEPQNLAPIPFGARRQAQSARDLTQIVRNVERSADLCDPESISWN